MKKIICFGLLFVLKLSLAIEEKNRVNVDVYYESLCTDSINFITKQLYPNMQGNLSEYINLTLVPFGKAEVIVGGQQSEITFKCHHGEDECKGNKIQACALRLIDNGKNSEGLGYNKITAGFITCLMEDVEKNSTGVFFPTKECAEKHHVHNLNTIENCASHPDASNYLSNLGSVTNSLEPKLKSVPTIVFNKKYQDNDNILAQNNFAKALCQYIKTDKPSECNGARGIVLNSIFLVLAITIKYFI